MEPENTKVVILTRRFWGIEYMLMTASLKILNFLDFSMGIRCVFNTVNEPKRSKQNLVTSGYQAFDSGLSSGDRSARKMLGADPLLQADRTSWGFGPGSAQIMMDKLKPDASKHPTLTTSSVSLRRNRI